MKGSVPARASSVWGEERGTVAELARRARGGDDVSRSRLFRLLAPAVLRWCRRLGGPSVDAEDAAQEVLVITHRRLAHIADLEALDAWVFGVTRRVVASRRRRAWWRRWLPGAPPERLDPGNDPSVIASQREQVRLVHRALATLPDKLREAIVMVDLEQLAIPEAADVLGVPAGTVKSRLRRGRDELKVALVRLGGDAS